MEFAYFCFAFQRSAHSPWKNRETLLSRAASWIYPSSPRGSQPHSKLSELPVADHQHGAEHHGIPRPCFSSESLPAAHHRTMCPTTPPERDGSQQVCFAGVAFTHRTLPGPFSCRLLSRLFALRRFLLHPVRKEP